MSQGYPGGGYAPQGGYGAPGYAPAYVPPPRKKRGMKRIIFGILGIIANGLGLVLMPVAGLFLGGIIAAIGLADLQPLPDNGSISLDNGDVVMIFAPADEAGSVTCDAQVSASDASVEKPDEPTEMDYKGTAYASVLEITAVSDGTATVTCEGASSVIYASTGIWGVLITGGIGLVIPIVLGFLAFVLLVWGIIARIRS